MLSPASLDKIDRELTKYPPDQRRSAVLAALTIAQDELGYLSADAMEFIADYLRMPPVAVFEVATFYEMYDVEPVGQYKLCICTNLPCALAGATEAAEHLKNKLGVAWNGTSADGRFTLKEGECFGACGDAPVMLVNNKRMLIGMTPRRIDTWVAEHT
jgi:NADH-quinone oxidoreductase subunit E